MLEAVCDWEGSEGSLLLWNEFWQIELERQEVQA